MLLEQRIENPIILTGQSYDPTRKYIVGEVVRATVGGESRGWILLVDAPAGTAPRANSAFWAIFTNTLMTNRGAQGLAAPTIMARYSADGTTFRAGYQDGDEFREVSYDGGTSWTRERIRGSKGEKGDTPVAKDGKDGKDAAPIVVEFLTPNNDWERRTTTVESDIAFRLLQNDERISGNIPIKARPGRDGKDSNIVFATDDTFANTSPVGRSIDTKFRFERDGLPVSVTYDVHPPNISGSGISRATAVQIAEDAAEARYPDIEKTKLSNIEDRATRDQTPGEIRTALESLGINLNDEIVDMHDGLRQATVDDYGKLGLGPEGKLYRVKRTANPGHDAEGMFGEYMHAQFRGVAHNRPSNPQVGQIYYNNRVHQWYLFFRNQVVAIIDAQPISPIQALGANTVWIGEVDDVYQARHAIENFDNTKAYYAVYGETLYVLDNSTYSAATTQTTYTYEWVPVVPDTLSDEDKVDKADLNPIVRITKNFVRRSELQTVFHLRVFNLDTVFPDVDQVKISFAGVSVINRGIDSTWTGEALSIDPAIAAQVLDGTVHGQQSWTVRTQLLKDDVVHYDIDTIVYIDVTEPPSTAIGHNTRRIEVVEDKTADMFVHREPGNFANNVDPRVAGVGIVLKNAVNQNALNSGSFDFNSITFSQTAVGVPDDDTNVYDLVVRTAKSLGRVEGEFRVYEMSAGTEFAFPLKQLIQEDDNWYYYFTVDARAGDSWFIQYRGTHPHNTYNGELGEHPLQQVDRRVQGGSLGKKTSQLVIIEEPGVFANVLDEDVASVTTVERTTANDTAITDNNFNWDGQTWVTPAITHTSDGNRYYFVVRIPKVLGDISSQFRVLTTDESKSIRMLGVSEANDATYNYYLADTNTDSITWTLQREGQVLRTRYDGEVPGRGSGTVVSGVSESEAIGIADARARARYTDPEKTQVAKIETIEDEIDALQTVTENVPISANVLWATSKVLATTETNAIVDSDWTLTSEVPNGVVLNSAGQSDIIDIPKDIRGELHFDIVDGDDNLIQRLAVDLHIDVFTFKEFGDNANKLRVSIAESTTDDTKLSVWLDNVSTVTFAANTKVKIYGVVALARADISGIRTRIETAETELAALKDEFSNIPISTEVLWLTSPVLETRGRVPIPQAAWTLADNAPNTISAFANIISLPANIRGDLHFELYVGDSLVERAIVPIHETETGDFIRLGNPSSFSDPYFNITVSVGTTASITINYQGGSRQANTTIRVYGVSALPVPEVTGVTQATLNSLASALRQEIAAVDGKFGGVPLNGPDAGQSQELIGVGNLNRYIPETNWVTVPVFSGTAIRRDPPQFGVSTTHLALYDRFLIRITLFRGSVESPVRLESTDFLVNVAEWDALTTVPQPTQSLANSQAGRISITASTKDNRALVHEFPQITPGPWGDTLPATGDPTADQQRALETAAQNAIQELRSDRRFIYIGKSNESNPRLLIAISGTNQDFIYEARGYH